MRRWTWFERDGSLKHRLQSSATTVTDKAMETMQRPFTISEKQYVALVEAGEADLIYASIEDNDALFRHITPLSERYNRLHTNINKLKKQGMTDLNSIKNEIVRILNTFYDKQNQS